MASMSVYEADAFDDLWNMDFGGYCTDALNEAAPIIESKMKANAKASVNHDGDSEMANSIKASKAKKSKNGAYIVNIGPRGYSKTKVYTAKNGKGVKTSRQYAVSNALKAIWKEYGIPNKQPAHPFISTTVSQTESQVLDLLQRKFEETIE